MSQKVARLSDPRALDLAEETLALIGKHPPAIAIGALTHVVALACLKSQFGLTEFMSVAEQKHALIRHLVGTRGS